jgi:hypothetical protein
MGKRVVVEGDAVTGTDTHNLSGPGLTPPSTPANYSGIGSFDYVGKMTESLSDFVAVDGRPLALTSSRSSLDPGETAPPSGRHSGPAVKNPLPPTDAPIQATVPLLKIDDAVGEGRPGAGAGSRLLKVGGVAALLDADRIDTCDGLGVPGNSSVAASGQDFVSCSE